MLNRLWSYRIGALLTALAILPLWGTAWFAIGEFRLASEARSQAQSVEADVEQLILLTELRTRLLDERNWHSALSGLQDLGITNALVLQLTGIDLPLEASTARNRVDELIVELALTSVAEKVAILRLDDQSSLTEVGFGYDEVETLVGGESERVLDSLLSSSGVAEQGDELGNALRVLEATTEARQAISVEFTHFFGAQFSSELSDSEDNVLSLIAARARRHDAQEKIERIAPESSAARRIVGTILESDNLRVYEQGVSSIINRSIGDRSEGEAPSLDGVLSDLEGVARLFTASSANTEIYFDLVNAAGSDVTAASASLGASAEGRSRRAIAAVTLFVLSSALFAAAATQAIARPVRRLSAVARSMSEGVLPDRLAVTRGPIEVREASRALNDAAEHLELAERQARALADGDLNHSSLTRPNPGRLGASLQDAVQTLAKSLQERERFRRQIAYEAAHDSLTQIANRRASLAQLQRSLARVGRSSSDLAVLFIDLDGFKEVNDRHGHLVGDGVLRVVAKRLGAAVREGDHVGRLGGDEFLVVAEPVSGIEGATELANRILADIIEPIKIDHFVVRISASVGIALSGDSPESTELLRDADLAVYKAKAEGRGRIELCDDELRTLVNERSELEIALRNAIAENELTLHYQPIINPVDESVQGLEALVRWERPGHGLVPPASFIPFAERSDLIVLVDQWVVGAVARQIQAWDQLGQYTDVSININVSGKHLASETFVDDVLTPLIDREIDPARITIEVTESALTEDLESAASKLQVLRDHGIRTAIDDFGTGYTSLAHLKSLPIDILKVDRTFTSDESAASLVQLIIDTGHLLGATITAEGIETPVQAAKLAEMGSDRLQGYLFGRPQDPAELDIKNTGSVVSGRSPDA